MVARARERAAGAAIQAGDLRGPLPWGDATFPWVITSHDSINYLTEPEDLASHFREVARILRPGGLYSLDVVSLFNIRHHFHGKQIIRRAKGVKLYWINHYDEKSRILHTELLFRKGSEEVRELHLQRFYTRTELVETARQAGLELLLVEGDYEEKPPGDKTSLINYHFVKRSPMRGEERRNG